MKLPFWSGKTEMLNNPTEGTPIKKLIPSETKRELEKLAGPMPRKEYSSGAELMNYLEEPRTIQEIQARFGYSTLASAYSSIHARIKRGVVINLGHGIYVSASAQVKSFNVGQLSERELQEKGLEAFTRQTAVKEQPKKPYRKPSDPGRATAKELAAIRDAIVFYCETPRTVPFINRMFGYKSPVGSMANIKKLLADGRLVRLPEMARTKKGQRTWLYQAASHVKTDTILKMAADVADAPMTSVKPIVPPPVPPESDERLVPTPETPGLFPRLYTADEVERLAMVYFWEKASYDKITRDGVKDFTAWLKTKDEKNHE